MKRFDFETWFRDHCNEPRADNGHHCNPMGILVDLFVHEAKFPHLHHKERAAGICRRSPAGRRAKARGRGAVDSVRTVAPGGGALLGPGTVATRTTPATVDKRSGVEKSLHRAEYRAHLFTMDLEELREQLDNRNRPA